MIAANNSSEILSGIIENVELTYGAVQTWANLYVAHNVPFDLLLGCLDSGNKTIKFLLVKGQMEHIHCSKIHSCLT